MEVSLFNKGVPTMSLDEARKRRMAPLNTPTDLPSNAVRDISGALNMLAADMFALYLKTKNFHWHVSGPHFRDYHLLLDEQADQIFATIDPIAERVRKVGGTTLRSVGHIARLQRILDNDADYVTPLDMLAELREDNKQVVAALRETHNALRRIRRRGDREPDRGLDRRRGTAHLVPVRGVPGRRDAALIVESDPRIFAFVGVADRLAEAKIQLAALQDHLARIHGLHRREGHGEIARVLDIDHEFGPSVR